MPKKDGREVLKEIKFDEKLKMIPVIVLTTSSNEDDVKMSYGNYASAYVTKPNDLKEFVDLIKLFEAFWFNCATLPPCD